jgi:hypothetical protein
VSERPFQDGEEDGEAICEKCTRSVPAMEINHCEECGLDGLCNECFSKHEVCW